MGGRQYLSVYKGIVDYLKAMKHSVLTEHIVYHNVLEYESTSSDQEIYERDIKYLHQSDLVIAEISNPSLGVGYEIGYALNISKKVLCIYDEKCSVSKMITGNKDLNLLIKKYSDINSCINIIEKFIEDNRI